MALFVRLPSIPLALREINKHLLTAADSIFPLQTLIIGVLAALAAAAIEVASAQGDMENEECLHGDC